VGHEGNWATGVARCSILKVQLLVKEDRMTRASIQRGLMMHLLSGARPAFLIPFPFVIGRSQLIMLHTLVEARFRFHFIGIEAESVHDGCISMLYYRVWRNLLDIVVVDILGPPRDNSPLFRQQSW
jgi:hypothetical protein